MPLLRTTVGNLLVNEALPEKLRDYRRIIDKKGLQNLLQQVAYEYPDQYADISRKLMQIGGQVSQASGGNSFGLAALSTAKYAKALRPKIKAELEAVLDNKELSDEEKTKSLVDVASKYVNPQREEIFKESLAENNPLAYQTLSGARGNKMNLASLRGSDIMYVDHRNRPIPFPVLRSVSEGMTPAEFWASAYGTRKGIIDLKLATRDAGFLGKQLAQIVHRLIVTGKDSEKEPETVRGFPVETSDSDNEGALLSHPAGGYPRNTVLTPKVLADLKNKNVARVLVRSPMIGGPEDGGLYARDLGLREYGRLPAVGENPAMGAANALAEPVTQGSLGSKHSGGIVGAVASQLSSGFNYISSLIQFPKVFPNGATHATLDGKVRHIEKAPAGGQYVWVDNERHFVHPENQVTVKQGDEIEAGDVLSDGNPNPAEIMQHKGVGEGRKYFVQAFSKALKDSGMGAHRRNIEILARGLINHVKLDKEMDEYVPDDIIPYQQLEHTYKPRPGFQTLRPKDALGQYLERPYLHHTIGSRVRSKMLKDFEEFGIKSVDVHRDPPPFTPIAVRGMSNLSHDPDWMTRMYGSGLKKSLLEGTQRGATSSTRGTSFVPGLAQAVDFGQVGRVVAPKVEELRMGNPLKDFENQPKSGNGILD